MIGAFLSETTYESLIHKLGHRGPRTTKELLDIATSHGKARQDEAVDEGTSDRSAKRKNKKQ